MGLNKFRVYVSGDLIQKLWNKVADDFTYQWMKGNRGNHGDWR